MAEMNYRNQVNSSNGNNKGPHMPDIRRMPKNPRSKFGMAWMISLLLLFIMLAWIGVGTYNNMNKEVVPLSNFAQLASEGKVESFKVVDETTVEAKLKDGRTLIAFKDPATDFATFLTEYGVDLSNAEFEITYPNPPSGITITDVVSILSLIGLGVLVFFLLRNMQSSGKGLFEFGQSKARMMIGKKQDIGFKDVAGIDEASEELQEVVMFLKQPKKFLKLGARIPKGVLLVGPPGTGKTLLARAIAGEAGVPFFHTSGAEFEEMLVGAGASRVRDLFKKAKRAAPALIFIDEVDAVARKRGTTISTSSATEQTLNQILVEMDGFEKNDNVIVIAATNRPDVLDPALLRPGRFDRRLMLDLPDVEGREEILKIHSKNKPLSKDVDLKTVAKRTVGFSGADLENMLNEAAIRAAKDGRSEVEQSDIEEAATKVTMGPEKKRKKTPADIKITAYHEAGHALVSRFVPESDPVHRVSIVSRGMSGGVTMYLPKEDMDYYTRTKLISKIKTLVAGHATEKLVFGDVTTGAASDIKQASRIARRMVKSFGMSDVLGFVKYGEDDEEEGMGYAYGYTKGYSEETAKLIDEEVTKIIKASYKEVEDILAKNRKKLDEVANILMEKEVLEGKDFDMLFESVEVEGEKAEKK